MEAVKNSQRTEGLVSTVVSIVTLIVGATTVLSALESRFLFGAEFTASLAGRGPSP